MGDMAPPHSWESIVFRTHFFPPLDDHFPLTHFKRPLEYKLRLISRAGHFRYFFNNETLFFAFFTKSIWLGVGFLNRTGAEIDY